jgi:hypothetical protein
MKQHFMMLNLFKNMRRTDMQAHFSTSATAMLLSGRATTASSMCTSAATKSTVDHNVISSSTRSNLNTNGHKHTSLRRFPSSSVERLKSKANSCSPHLTAASRTSMDNGQPAQGKDAPPSMPNSPLSTIDLEEVPNQPHASPACFESIAKVTVIDVVAIQDSGALVNGADSQFSSRHKHSVVQPSNTIHSINAICLPRHRTISTRREA